MTNDQRFLLLALKYAELGRGWVAPNPAVGAVVEKKGRIIATGYHQGPGTAHAERMVLQKLSDEQCEGATLYVTLEPCCHHGRTPPCTDLIIAKKIKRVVYGADDPNPLVAKKGAAQLKANQIVCQKITLPAIQRFYASYVYWWKTGKPWVTIKLAISADHKIAAVHGKPAKITDARINYFTHKKRYKADALLSTAKTVYHDDPQLNVRLHQNVIEKPVYLLDRTLSFPLDARLCDTAKTLTLFYDASIKQVDVDLAQSDIVCMPVNTSHSLLDLNAVLKAIGLQGVHDLWVEVGMRCFNAFLREQLVNEVYLYRSDVVLGEGAVLAQFDETFQQEHLKKSNKTDNVILHWYDLETR